ncbi:MAG: hypothetical protein ACLFUW_04355 [Bacteroidales bacterium]
MEIKGFVNGKEIERDSYDLDYIEIDIVQDFVREIEHDEENPTARVEVDMSRPEEPSYRLIDCSDHFRNEFFHLLKTKKFS